MLLTQAATSNAGVGMISQYLLAHSKLFLAREKEAWLSHQMTILKLALDLQGMAPKDALLEKRLKMHRLHFGAAAQSKTVIPRSGVGALPLFTALTQDQL